MPRTTCEREACWQWAWEQICKYHCAVRYSHSSRPLSSGHEFGKRTIGIRHKQRYKITSSGLVEPQVGIRKVENRAPRFFEPHFATPTGQGENIPTRVQQNGNRNPGVVNLKIRNFDGLVILTDGQIFRKQILKRGTGCIGGGKTGQK